MPFLSLFRRRAHAPHRRSTGQSLTELALVLPVLLLITLTALDFGRVYLGWINLQNMARIAANFAANNPLAWSGSGDADAQSRYASLIVNDARATNCDLPPAGPANDVPTPTFSAGTDLGDPAEVAISCTFDIITPVIGAILGNQITVGANAVFPIKSGGVAGIPIGGGGTGTNSPNAEFNASPVSGTAPLLVQFTDLSTNGPVAWTWTFGDGGSSNAQHPSHAYNAPGTYSVSLTATNADGSNTENKVGYITVNPAPGSGPVPDFSATPTAGNAPLAVSFSDLSTGSPTSWQWDFDGDGTVDSTSQNPSHTYTSAGSYSVTLTVSNASGSNSQTKTGLIVVAAQLCTVPNVSDGDSASQAVAAINAAGLVGVQDQPGNWKVGSQSPQGGLQVPCGSTVTVSK